MLFSCNILYRKAQRLKKYNKFFFRSDKIGDYETRDAIAI